MPRPFEDLLMGHECIHTSRLGWGRLGNGTLLRVAESEGFEAMVTVDRNLPYQQNLPDRSIALVIIESRSNSIHTLTPLATLVLTALEDLEPGTVVRVRPE